MGHIGASRARFEVLPLGRDTLEPADPRRRAGDAVPTEARLTSTSSTQPAGPPDLHASTSKA